MELKQIYNPNIWNDEDIFVWENPSSKESKQTAKNTFEQLKRKEKTFTQLSLLKEKINADLENEENNSHANIEVKKIFETLKTDADANYEMWLYYNIKWESKLGARHWKKSLEISKKFETRINDFLRDRILEPILDWYEYKREEGTLNFIKEFKNLLLPIIKETKKITTDKKKTKILNDLISFLKQ
jgi:hypothetical protein